LQEHDKYVYSGVKPAWATAVKGGDEKMIRLLVKGGVDVNARNIVLTAGQPALSALELVTNKGDVKTAALLLKIGADWRQGFHKATEISLPYWSQTVAYYRGHSIPNVFRTHLIEAALAEMLNEHKRKAELYENILSRVSRIHRMCLIARLAPHKEGIIAGALHPRRVEKWVEAGVEDMMFGL
jgi:hypothetical protein